MRAPSPTLHCDRFWGYNQWDRQGPVSKEFMQSSEAGIEQLITQICVHECSSVCTYVTLHICVSVHVCGVQWSNHGSLQSWTPGLMCVCLWESVNLCRWECQSVLHECMYACVYEWKCAWMCVFLRIFVWVHANGCVCVNACMFLNVHMTIWVHMCADVWVNTFSACDCFVSVRKYVFECTCVSARVCAKVCVSVTVCMHACMSVWWHGSVYMSACLWLCV